MARLAIVGVGGYGANIIDSIPLGGCTLAAVADSCLDRCTPAVLDKVRSMGAAIYDDAFRMFADLKGRCDGVYLATSIPSHARLTIAAARAGYHVLLEKPPAATVQEIDDMLAALKETNKCCLVGFQAIHGDDIQTLKSALVSGKLGRVERLSCAAGWPRDASYYGRNDWAGRLKSGEAWVLDGPATNALLHQINNMLYLASPVPGKFALPASVRAELYAANAIDSHDTAAIEIRTAEGPTVYFLASHCTTRGANPTIEVRCEKGRILWNLWSDYRIEYADGTCVQGTADKNFNPKMVANFAQAIHAGDGACLRQDLAEARKTMLAINGAYESSRRVRRIEGPTVRRVNEGTPKAITVVDGLVELLVDAAQKGVLLSDLSDKPAWACATKAFDLAGYERFPVQFQTG